MSADDFIKAIQQGYTFEGSQILLGAGMVDNEVHAKASVAIPLKTMNRHGLIAGSTGSGKTKTIQLLAEHLSLQGVPSLLMDLKGDLSGLAVPGEISDGITARHEKLGIPFKAEGLPVELLSLSDEPGVRLRATLTEFGPVLFSKILGLNDNQSGIVAILFKYAYDQSLPLVDLDDFKELLLYAEDKGKDEISKNYGRVSSTSVGSIRRRLIELEAQGGDRFFGEPSYDISDLMNTDVSGEGRISIIRLCDLQNRAKLFSSFMLGLLSEIYAGLPEVGDINKPKLVVFIDEAHLIFDKASKALLEQLEAMVKLIRSKGVGLVFCTQNPTDIPDAILAQCGMKIQHALRAFTAKDRKAIKLAAQNYPDTEFYETDKLLTALGIGEALVTVLDEKAKPTPLAHVMLRAPMSRMGTLTDTECQALVTNSALVSKYAKSINRESAKEILSKKMQEKVPVIQDPRTPVKKGTGLMSQLSKNTMVRQIGRTVMREVTRALMKMLGIRRR